MFDFTETFECSSFECLLRTSLPCTFKRFFEYLKSRPFFEYFECLNFLNFSLVTECIQVEVRKHQTLNLFSTEKSSSKAQGSWLQIKRNAFLTQTYFPFFFYGLLLLEKSKYRNQTTENQGDCFAEDSIKYVLPYRSHNSCGCGRNLFGVVAIE